MEGVAVGHLYVNRGICAMSYPVVLCRVVSCHIDIVVSFIIYGILILCHVVRRMLWVMHCA